MKKKRDSLSFCRSHRKDEGERHKDFLSRELSLSLSLILFGFNTHTLSFQSDIQSASLVNASLRRCRASTGSPFSEGHLLLMNAHIAYNIGIPVLNSNSELKSKTPTDVKPSNGRIPDTSRVISIEKWTNTPIAINPNHLLTVN